MCLVLHTLVYHGRKQPLVVIWSPECRLGDQGWPCTVGRSGDEDVAEGEYVQCLLVLRRRAGSHDCQLA